MFQINDIMIIIATTQGRTESLDECDLVIVADAEREEHGDDVED